MATIKLRLQTPIRAITVDSLKTTDTFADLGVFLLEYFKLNSVSNYKIVSRVLRKSFILGDLSVATQKLGDFFMSGDLILLEVPETDKKLFDTEENQSSYGSSNIATMSSIENSVENDVSIKVDSNRILKRFQIAANNSCFFLAFQFCLTGIYRESSGSELRDVVADYILANPEPFSGGVLENGQTTQQYAAWIKKPESWGGAIEIQILSEIYSVCVRVMNIKEAAFMPLDNEHHNDCIYLRFDGAHYDALIANKSDGKKQTRFRTDDEAMFNAVKEYGRHERGKSNYVDVSEMRYQCAICSAYCKDSEQMSMHSKATGHSNFNQVN